MSNKLSIQKIETVKDLIKATVAKGATIGNGGYDLFYTELKKYIVTKKGKLMLWEDWYNKPHPLISKTEDADFEIVEIKLLENGK